MVAGTGLALLGVALGLIGFGVYRLWRAVGCGCVSCVAFVKGFSMCPERKP